MATIPLVPVEEYLASHYRPDREYIDGTIEERNLGEYDHARLQGKVYAWFDRRERDWGIRAIVEQRMRVSETRYRVPDVAVFRRDQPIEQVFTYPPLIIIEILSPRDSPRTIENRVQDYLNFGVEHIWVIDPAKPVEAWVATREQLTRAGDRLEIPGTPLYLTISELEL